MKMNVQLVYLGLNTDLEIYLRNQENYFAKFIKNRVDKKKSKKKKTKMFYEIFNS